jgi:CheY-like chemotaxis protein
MNHNDEDTDWIIEDDAVTGAESALTEKPETPPGPAPWRILIVDDDVDVHVVTKFSLSNVCFQGRRLSFLHAYSGDEALTVLAENPDIALVLLDVIMETSDAGLIVARQIREVLHNTLVRVVLRTGQPGQALEHSIILDYDINDFWCKTDLTTRKLFTTVIASLRAYEGLQQAQQQTMQLRAELELTRQLLASAKQVSNA